MGWSRESCCVFSEPGKHQVFDRNYTIWDMEWEETTGRTSQSFQVCYAYASCKESLKKLEDRSKQVVHLGIEKGSKAYRLLDPDTGSMFASRDVVFEENWKLSWETRKKIKSTPWISFTVEGFDFDQVNDSEVRPIPHTLIGQEILQVDVDWRWVSAH